MSAPALAVGSRVLVAEPVHGSNTVTRLVDGIVQACESDRAFVVTERVAKWYPLALVVPVVKPDVERRPCCDAAIPGGFVCTLSPGHRGAHKAGIGEGVFVAECVNERDVTALALARAYAEAEVGWYAAAATGDLAANQAAFRLIDQTKFALFDALIPGWRETYEAAWGPEGCARRAAAIEAAKAAEVSP